MMEELTDLRNSILAGRYQDALRIIDELEEISKEQILLIKDSIRDALDPEFIQLAGG